MNIQSQSSRAKKSKFHTIDLNCCDRKTVEFTTHSHICIFLKVLLVSGATEIGEEEDSSLCTMVIFIWHLEVLSHENLGDDILMLR